MAVLREWKVLMPRSGGELERMLNDWPGWEIKTIVTQTMSGTGWVVVLYKDVESSRSAQ
jgi:hypothetical protein